MYEFTNYFDKYAEHDEPQCEREFWLYDNKKFGSKEELIEYLDDTLEKTDEGTWWSEPCGYEFDTLKDWEITKEIIVRNCMTIWE